MALEMRYQSVPGTWKWIPQPQKAADNNSMFAFLAAEQPPPQPTPVWPPRLETQPTITPAGADFGAELLNLIRETSGLAQRNCYLGHYWDILHYLLAERRRAGEAGRGIDWASRAIVGGDELQGIKFNGTSIFFLPHAELQTTCYHLNQVKPEQLAEHYDVQAMIRLGVYHSISLLGKEKIFAEIWHAFDRLRTFYLDVAAHEEGVIAYMS
ncbi:MAG: DUF1877 family protein [Anaerolineaceae bacterium]|nr:DUF1877 family protein [Anaerolineaceae bacterium]